MQETVLSARRSSLNSDDDSGAAAAGDELNSKKQLSISAKLASHVTSKPMAISFLIIFVIIASTLLSQSRCQSVISPFDSLPKIALFGAEREGLASDSGSLGVPWCGGHSCFKDSDEARIRAKKKKFWEKAMDTDKLCRKGESWWGVRGQMRDDFNHKNKEISYAEHFENSRFVESVLDVYWEPAPVAGTSLMHQTRYDPAHAPHPIIEDGRFGLFQRLGLTKFETSVFNGCTQMVYLQISPPAA